MSIGDLIRTKRAALRMTQGQLGQTLGVKAQAVSQWENSITEPSRDKLVQLAGILGIELESFLSSSAPDARGATAPTGPAPPMHRPPPQLFDNSNRMPVYASAEGGEGELIVDNNPVDYVPRPYVLEHVKQAFAVVVTGESMVPAYKPGDRAWVNPQIKPLGGDDCILYSNHHELGEDRALIKEYVRATSTHWIVRQHNPPKELKLAKNEWQRIYKVVGKFNRG